MCESYTWHFTNSRFHFVITVKSATSQMLLQHPKSFGMIMQTHTAHIGCKNCCNHFTGYFCMVHAIVCTAEATLQMSAMLQLIVNGIDCLLMAVNAHAQQTHLQNFYTHTPQDKHIITLGEYVAKKRYANALNAIHVTLNTLLI
jgi:fumarate reductase subunit C